MYSTAEKIRNEAWFTKNDNIHNSTIILYQKQATSVVNSIISKRYDIKKMIYDSNFWTSNAKDILWKCETLLGAWYLLNKEYDIQQDPESEKWKWKINEAYDILSKILNWKIRLISLSTDNNLNINNTWDEYPTKSTSWDVWWFSYPNNDQEVFKFDNKY